MQGTINEFKRVLELFFQKFSDILKGIFDLNIKIK
jgi:hypothetical protein